MNPLRLLMLMAFAASLQACSASDGAGAPPLATVTRQDPPPAATSAASGTVEVNTTPSSTPQPLRLIFAVEERWLSEVETALEALQTDLLPAPITLMAVEPARELIDQGGVDLLLLPDATGIPVAQRTLALAVPFRSDWQQVTREQATSMLTEDSEFFAVLEWPAMTPDLKALRIDGLHPSQPDYPLKTTWSLLARPGLEEVAANLAPALSPHLNDEVVQVVAVGDIMLARGLGARLQSGEDLHPFAAIEHLLSSADLTIGNLESALGDGGRPADKGYTFLAPPEAAVALAQAGFDVLSLANNHAMDFGSQTLLQAITLLEEQGIHSVGAGRDASEAYAALRPDDFPPKLTILAYVDVPIEFRGFDTRLWRAGDSRPGVAWADPDRMRKDIAAEREWADIVIVLLHSGYEYLQAPSPPQESAARLAIDAGADLVIGHHAHVLQGVEFYAEGIILYGLGNFAFEESGVLESGLINLWLDADGVRSLEFIPLILAQDGRPLPPDPESAEAIRAAFYSLTRKTTP